MKIETLEISGVRSALEALRLPYGLECRSKTLFNLGYCAPKLDDFCEENDEMLSLYSESVIKPNDLILLSTLVKRGPEHAKCIRGINVYAKITAPRLFWQEFDTYRIGVEKLNSTSTMHTISKRPLTINDFDVSKEIKEILTPKNEPVIDTVLHFDAPKELKSVILHKYGRDYEVWNNGDIYALEFTFTEKMPNGKTRTRTFPKTKLKLGYTRTKQGYFQVGIGGKKGKIEMVHRIFAEAFVPNPNPEKYTIVNHIDGDKGNCSPTNLEWCDYSINNQHAFDTGLKAVTLHQKYLNWKNSRKYSEDEITSWKVMKEGGMTFKDISEKTGVSIYTLQNWIEYNGCYQSEYGLLFQQAYTYEKIIEELNNLISLSTEDSSYIEDIKQLLPESFIQTRIVQLNYQSLRNIYFQRRNHRLPEWREFCTWIESLPYSKEFITIE